MEPAVSLNREYYIEDYKVYYLSAVKAMSSGYLTAWLLLQPRQLRTCSFTQQFFGTGFPGHKFRQSI